MPIKCHIPSRVFALPCVLFSIFTVRGKYIKNINSLKNAIRQEIANVTQDILRRVMASVPGRWQQCLDCNGGHLQDVVLKT